jgi:hypothetical protein
MRENALNEEHPIYLLGFVYIIDFFSEKGKVHQHTFLLGYASANQWWTA